MAPFGKRNKLPTELDYLNSCLGYQSKHVVYSAYFHDEDGNLGDRIIPKLGLDLIKYHSSVPLNFKIGLARSKDQPDKPIYDKNELVSLKGVVIGPGGLLTGKHKTKSKNNKLFLNFNSDDAKRMSDNNIPVFFWATGVNKWSNKNNFTDEIKNEIIKIFENISHGFLRGSADINFLKGFLPTKDHSKLVFQPCPSFFLDKLRGVQKASDNGLARVAINIAADHIREFYNESDAKPDFWKRNQKHCLSDFAKKFQTTLNSLESNNLQPIFFCNTKEDTEYAIKFFNRYQRVDTHMITNTFIQPEELYGHFDLCIGMRLHSWLPFLGLGIPSLFITPFAIRSEMPKDFGIGELSFRYTEGTYAELGSYVQRLIESRDLWKKRIDESKVSLGNVSKNNVNVMLGAF